ncbi:MAG: DUF1778 domain-containing protein [Verrucomicrobia bacterium]|nr:DUF1778 domain-containing protein [Verrucomicrobiota bacterium]
MSATTQERKSERLVARVSKAHKQLFERAAAIEGHSVATFVIAHATEAAEQLLRDQEIIRLNSQQSRRFVEALLAAPSPASNRMKRSVRLYRKSVVKG